MRRSFLAILLCGSLGGGLLFLGRCFSPELPSCAYICNPDEPRCPDDYECRADGYCHLKGNSEACPYTMDLLPAPPRLDMSMPSDQSLPPDQSIVEGGTIDM